MTWDGEDRRGGENISRTIGSLERGQESLRSQVSVIFEKLDKQTDKIADHNSQVNDKLNAILSIQEQVGRHETDISQLKSFKNKSLIGLALVFGGGGVAGAYVDKVKDFFHLN